MKPGRLYVRSRGQVLGPFDLTELRSLRDRGQLRRFHEVSEDGGQWLSAACLTELFPGDGASSAETETLTTGSSSPVLTDPAALSLAPSQRAEWFYAGADERQHGPINEAELDALWADGVLDDQSLVWRPGMRRWEPYAASRSPGHALDPDVGDWKPTRTGMSWVLAGSYVTPVGWGLILLTFLLLGGSSDRGRDALLMLGWLTELLALGLCLVGYGYCLAGREGPRRLAQGFSGLALTGAVLMLTAFTRELAGGQGSAHAQLVGGWLGLVALGVNTLSFLVFLFFLRAVARARRLGSVAQALTTLHVSWACFVGAVVLFSVVLYVTVGLTGEDHSVDGRIRELEAAGAAFVLFVVVSLLLLLALYGWYLVLLRQVREALRKDKE